MLVDGSGSAVAPPIPKPAPTPAPGTAAAATSSAAPSANAAPAAAAPGPAAKPDGIDLSSLPQLSVTPPVPLNGSTPASGTSTAMQQAADQIGEAFKKIGLDLGDALKLIFSGPPDIDGLPASQNGLPPAGSMDASAAVKDKNQQPAGPGLFTGDTSKPDQNAQEAFYQVTGEGSDQGVVSAYINGTLLDTNAAQYGGLSKSQASDYTSMSQTQRVQTVMQALGPVGTATYLGRLQNGISNPDSGNNWGNNQQTAQNFSNGFTTLVDQGQITNGDIKSLAAAPANIIDQGDIFVNQPSNADLAAGVANLFGNMPTNLNDPKILAAQNAFVGASYDTGAALVGSSNSKDQEAGQVLYAQGSQALSETPFTNQSQVLYDMGASKVGDVVKNSLSGEGVLADGADQKTPLTGTAGLLNTLTANAYDDDGARLPSDSVQQQEITSAYKATVDSISNKGDGDYQNLMNSDLNGSGLRQSLSKLFAAGLPSILNSEAVKSSGGSDPVAPGEINATDLGKFMEFELGGHYASQSQGETVGQNIGGALGEFYNDTASLQKGNLPSNFTPSKPGETATQAFKEKYGSQLFANSPNSGLTNQNAATQNALSIFGAALHGANEGFSDLDSRNATDSDRWASNAGFLGGLVATAGAALSIDPETAPLGALISAVGGGAGAASFIPDLNHDVNPSGNLDWAGTYPDQTKSFTDSPLYQLLGSVFNNSTFSPQDKDAFARGLTVGQ